MALIIFILGHFCGHTNSYYYTKIIKKLFYNKIKYVLNYITIRKKSIAEVLDIILVWTGKHTTEEKWKQSVERTPPVITSDKWIEIIQAKVNEKKTKRRRKELKKQKEQQEWNKIKRLKRKKSQIK